MSAVTTIRDDPNFQNVGLKWFEEEELILLDELANNIDIDTIALNHKRTGRSIICNIQKMAYFMHKDNVRLGDIMDKLKLSNDELNYAITKYEKKYSKHVNSLTNKKSNKHDELESIKNSLTELHNKVDMILEFIKQNN